MAILDRPMFQRRLTKDELRRYGLPAFANGGIVGMGPGQSLAMTGGTRYAGVPRPKTADELLQEDYGSLGKLLAGEKAKAKREQEARAQEKMLLEQARIDKERAEKDKADREAMALLREKEEKKEKEKNDDFVKSPAKEGSDTVDRTTEKIGEEEEKISDLDALKKKYLEKSELYKELLGNPEEMNRRQGFLQLAQFGLNLASAQGSNFLDKVAKSAKDPLEAFAELGRKAYEDERAVNLLALEATEKDISAEREAELEKELAEIKKSEDSQTNFQKNLATIDAQLGDTMSMEQKILIARGLSAGDSREDRIYNVFDTISNLPLNLGKTEGQLMADAAALVDAVSGGTTDNVETSETEIITEDMITAALAQNPNVDRETIIKDLESKGFDVSNLK
jgi:hypothetical protein